MPQLSHRTLSVPVIKAHKIVQSYKMIIHIIWYCCYLIALQTKHKATLTFLMGFTQKEIQHKETHNSAL